jgi:hypothetical protein
MAGEVEIEEGEGERDGVLDIETDGLVTEGLEIEGERERGLAEGPIAKLEMEGEREGVLDGTVPGELEMDVEREGVLETEESGKPE